jgi:hypothetical protein
MTYTELDNLTREALAASERNERISRHIQHARRHLLLMAAALMLIALALYSAVDDMRTLAVVWIAGVGMGYSLRAIIGHLRRRRRYGRH